MFFPTKRDKGSYNTVKRGNAEMMNCNVVSELKIGHDRSLTRVPSRRPFSQSLLPLLRDESNFCPIESRLNSRTRWELTITLVFSMSIADRIIGDSAKTRCDNNRRCVCVLIVDSVIRVLCDDRTMYNELLEKEMDICIFMYICIEI